MNKMRIGLCAIAFAVAPYIFLRPHAVNFTLFDFLLIIISALLIFKGYNLTGNYKGFYILVFSFLFFSSASIYNTSNQTEAIVTTLQYFFIFLILFPTIGRILNFDLYKKFIFLMVVGWCVFAIFNLSLLSNSAYHAAGRFISLYNGPDEIGIMAALMTPLLIYALSITKGIKGLKGMSFKVLILFGTSANIAMLLASGTRSALVALFVGILLLLLLRFGVSFKLILSSVLIAVVGLGITSTLNVERNALSRLSTSENITVRIHDYIISFEAIADYFVLGAGLGTSGGIMPDYGGDFRPHNMFLNVFLETGVLGLISFIGILCLCLFFGLRLFLNVLLKNKKVNLLVAATLSSGVILLISQQFTTIAVYRGYWLFWALCLWMSTQSEHFYLDRSKKMQEQKFLSSS